MSLVKRAGVALAVAVGIGAGWGDAGHAETAQSITFNITSYPQKSGSWTIENAYIGNMADPNACTSYYYQPPPGRSWTWSNRGNNTNPFGIVVNYRKSGGSSADTQSAFRCVVVDPNNMPAANNTVVITLTACDIFGAANNPGLLVNSSSGGATVKGIGGQPRCS